VKEFQGNVTLIHKTQEKYGDTITNMCACCFRMWKQAADVMKA